MEKLNLIYGRHAIEEFLQKHPQLIKKIWVKDREIFSKIQKEFKKILVFQLENQEIDTLIGEKVNHQGWLAEIKEYHYLPFFELEKNLVHRDKDLILILDQIHDAHNFGSIIRSASLLGVKNLIILDHRQVLVNATVVKTSSGSVYDLQITKVANLSQVLKILKKNDYWIYASNLNQNATDLRGVKFGSKSVLVIGNEEKGVSDLVTKNSDLNLFIPSTKKINSFNAAVAGAIILYAIATQLEIF